MEPLTARAIAFGARWWLENRPFSKENRVIRAERKRIRRENRRLKKLGLPLLEEPQMAKLLDFLLPLLAEYRTSTKSGGTGLVVPPLVAVAALLPFYDEIAAFIQRVCTEPDPTNFLIAAGVGWAVTWVSMFVSARVSKTPTNPGRL